MKLEDYLEKRKEQQRQEKQPRETCSQCGFSLKTCYCSQIKPFDPQMTFVILIHQLEIDRKIATGRMSHLILQNSFLIRGGDYSEDTQVNRLVNDPDNYCVVLFPGQHSTNLSQLNLKQKKNLFPSDKRLVVFVIDGTWATARHTMRVSRNLVSLPRLSFDLSRPSNFRIRKQPKAECCSTIEAIYETIEHLGPSRNFDLGQGLHENLLQVFDYMIEKQLVYQSNQAKS